MIKMTAEWTKEFTDPRNRCGEVTITLLGERDEVATCEMVDMHVEGFNRTDSEKHTGEDCDFTYVWDGLTVRTDRNGDFYATCTGTMVCGCGREYALTAESDRCDTVDCFEFA